MVLVSRILVQSNPNACMPRSTLTCDFDPFSTLHRIKVYITDHTSTPEHASEQLRASEPVMEEVFKSPNSMRLINLGKEWLCNFLPHAMSKINRVSYGLIHQSDIERWQATEAAAQGAPIDLNLGPSRELLAVPFTGKDTPSRNSEFAHPEVLIV